MKKYKTTYKDKIGTEESEFHSDGSDLSITLRGIQFTGECFDSLEGKIDNEKFEYILFQGQEEGDITNCKFKVDIPITVMQDEQEITKLLQADIQINHKEQYGVKLQLESSQNSISNSKIHGYFEDALIEIQNQLPKNEKLKCCLSCKFSHYSPYGSGLFGSLYCFKKVKEKTAEINSKCSLFDVWAFAHENNKLFNVQETFECEEHEFITDEDWNYSNWR